MSFAPSQSISVKTQDRVLGLVVAITLGLGFYWFSHIVQPEDSARLVVNANMASSYGISPGAPVRISGVVVGEVSTMDLMANGEVAMSLSLDQQYQSLYNTGSVLKIDTTLGLDSVLSGTGIVFYPGQGQPLKPGDSVAVEEPKSLNALMEEWDVQNVIEKAVDVLTELESLVAVVNENQGMITQSMTDINNVTASVAEASQRLPDAIDGMITAVETINTTVSTSQSRMDANMVALQVTLDTSNQLLTRLNTIAVDAEPIIKNLPDSQNALQALLWELRGLTSQLRGHWLLGSDQDEQDPIKTHPVIYPPDEDLYHIDNTPPPDNEGNTQP